MMARDKSKTIKTALQCNIPCPSTFFPDEEAIADIARKVTYPALVKPNIGSGARGITLVGSAEELERAYLDIRDRYGECHIQEYVPKGGSQYKADLFLDTHRDLKAGIVYCKLRYFPISGGSSVMNRAVHKPEIIENGYQLLRAMDWCGFADFDFITDPRDGVAKLMEINPRMPNTFRIGLAAGIDFPAMIVNLIRGEEIPSKKEYDLDTYLRYFALDILWFLKSPDRFRADLMTRSSRFAIPARS
jgi:predicted ATP-grasp superfamily ATP-dependent carboligase